MKMILIIIAALLAASATAQDCETDDVCNRGCINNTIDGFDPDCGVPEANLYTKSAGAPPASVKEDKEEGLPAVLAQLCPEIKDGVCETTCEGVDLDCLCGDFECQTHESASTCPMDRRHEQNSLCAIAHDGYCDIGCQPFDADCVTQTIVRRTQDVQTSFGLSEHTVYATLAIILIMLCAIVIYLMHKAFEIKKEEGIRGQ